jgi:hypothetical protein
MRPQLQAEQQTLALMWLFCPSRRVLSPQPEAKQRAPADKKTPLTTEQLSPNSMVSLGCRRTGK